MVRENVIRLLYLWFYTCFAYAHPDSTYQYIPEFPERHFIKGIISSGAIEETFRGSYELHRPVLKDEEDHSNINDKSPFWMARNPDYNGTVQRYQDLSENTFHKGLSFRSLAPRSFPMVVDEFFLPRNKFPGHAAEHEPRSSELLEFPFNEAKSSEDSDIVSRGIQEFSEDFIDDEDNLPDMEEQTSSTKNTEDKSHYSNLNPIEKLGKTLDLLSNYYFPSLPVSQQKS